MLLALLPLISCRQDDVPESDPVTEAPLRKQIRQVWSISMYRILPFTPVEVLRFTDGTNCYLPSGKTEFNLVAGDYVSFELSPLVKNEIVKINGYGLEEAKAADPGLEERSLVATDPVEADIVDVFEMDVFYPPVLPGIPTLFIETAEQKLIYVKKGKVTQPLSAGDRIVYNCYLVSPFEVLAVKKLR